jgi:D-glycero-D-manno-heptose 1,7-bisphosphate phosphatase
MAKSSPIVGDFVALDFDGTILKNRSWAEMMALEIHESVFEAVNLLTQKGKGIIITTNRPEITRGAMKQESYVDAQNAIVEALKSQGANVLGVWYCPSTDKNDPYLKPNPGMFMKLKAEHGIDWKKTPVLASSIADVKAAAAVGAEAIVIENDSFTLKSLGSLRLGKQFKSFPSLLDYAKSL